MAKDKCCDDDGSSSPSTPSRETSGSPLPDAGSVGMTMLAGANGKDEQGNPVARVVGTTPDGSLKISMTEAPHGVDGTLTIDNGVLVYRNGRVISISTPGSGLVSWAPATA